MIPLILHHRIVDPLDITLTACAEEWHQNMNARLAYDFVLLFVLFILPLTLMTYCYVRISLSLWFIDPNVRTSMTLSMGNAARFSTISEDFQQQELNPIRRHSSQKNRPYYIHYHKIYENGIGRQQHQEQDEYRSLMISTGNKTASIRPRRSTTINDIKPKSFSITTTTGNTMTTHTTCRRSSSLVGRRFGENGCACYPNQIQLPSSSSHIQGRQKPIRHRQSTSPYTSGILRSSVTSLPGHNRIIGNTNSNTNGHSAFRESQFNFRVVHLTSGSPVETREIPSESRKSEKLFKSRYAFCFF
jgi:hypothetical protein